MNQITQFPKIQGAVPYAKLATLESMSAAQIVEYEAKFGEATFDEVVADTVIRTKIFQESALISATGGVIVSNALDKPEAEIFAPGDDAVRVTYPVPIERVGTTQRAEPVQYNVQKVGLDMAEVRYFLSDDAKIRGHFDWLEQDSIQRAIEHMAEVKDKHVLTGLKAAAPAGNDVAATAVWTGATANPEDDVAEAIRNIINNSNMPSSQFNKPNAFALILPAKAWDGVHKLKLVRNIIQPIQEFIQTEYKTNIVITRKPRVESTWPIDTEALVVPMGDRSIGFLGTWDGGGIVPSQERMRVAGRGDDIISREWFKWTTVPEPLDGSVTTNARIARITGVAV